MADLKRRRLLAGAGAGLLAFGGLRTLMHGAPVQAAADIYWRFGSLKRDPDKVLDLPDGFSYRVLSRVGERMDDGLRVPARHDGMAAFAGRDGRVVLIRNHELAPVYNKGRGAFGTNDDTSDYDHADRIYDPGHGHAGLGGTTNVVYNPETGEVEKHFLSLAGTELNCAGGPTPWNTWVSCEETVSVRDQIHEQDHGYCFEVTPHEDPLQPVKPVALKAMGRFKHEAICVDPRSGVVYLTEDEGDGLFYRFIPTVPGKLSEGGRLQALAIRGAPRRDTGNWLHIGMIEFPKDQPMACEWIDLDDPESPKGNLRLRGYRHGAARFIRSEGIWWAGDRLYFTATQGGRQGLGQVFCYWPSEMEGKDEESSDPGQIALFVETHDGRELSRPDNITLTPWGDMLMCEDTSGTCGMVGVTPEGRLYRFARNAMNDSELAGACFAPNGKTLFVNIQEPGLTLAITGPFSTPP